MNQDTDNINPQPISRRFFLAAGAATGGLWLVGCGSDSDSSDPTIATSGSTTPDAPTETAGEESTAASTGGPAETTAPAATTERTANLRVTVPTDIQPDGILRFTPGNRPLRRTVYDVVVDRTSDGEYVPSLASGWEWNDDGTSLVMTLRDDVMFHSGRPFGADDVVFLVEQAVAEGSGAQVAALLRRGDLQKSGDHELTVTFEQPFASYLDAFSALPVIDSETFESIESGDALVGTGPFVFNSWTPGSQFDMDRNESYWGGDVAFDKLSFQVVSEPQAALAAMRSGDADMTAGMIPRDAASLDGDGFSVYQSPGFDLYVGLNTAVAPLDDVRVRQAIAYALDRERIVDQVFSGFAEASSVPWSSDTPGVTGEMIDRYAYNIEQGRALIEEAGATGMEVLITPSPQEPTYSAVADIVLFGLTEIGLAPKTATVDAAEFPTLMQGGAFEGIWVAIVGLTSLGVPTSLLTANPLLAGENTHNFTDPQYGEFVNAVVDAASDDDQADAVSELTTYMLDEAFHNTVVQATSLVVAVDKIDGIELDSTLSLVLTGASMSA
ncbi:MAG: ABC transporter substrate-binding protein [Ilumatobacter sp.]